MNILALAPLFAAMCLVSAPVLAAASPGSHPGTPALHDGAIKLKIGVAAPLTGQMSWVGGYVREAVRMTVEEINGAPGHRVHLDVVFADSKSTPDGAIAAVNHLLENDHISLLLGPMLSREALATETIAEKARIPQVFPISASHLITREGDPWAIRTGEDEWIQGELLTDWLLRHPHLRSVAVLSLPDAYSSSGADGLVRGLKSRGVDPVFLDRVKPADFDDAAIQIRQRGAQAVGFFGYPDDAIALLSALKTHHVNLQVVSGCALAGQAFVTKAGRRADGMIVASEFSPSDPAAGSRLFTERFVRRFHHQPSNQHALIYVALWLIHSAALRAGSAASEKLRFALHHIHGMREATGLHSIDRTGEDTRCPLLLRIENGKFVFLEKGRWSPQHTPQS